MCIYIISINSDHPSFSFSITRNAPELTSLALADGEYSGISWTKAARSQMLWRRKMTAFRWRMGLGPMKYL
jgi:hypothetical protein